MKQNITGAFREDGFGAICPRGDFLPCQSFSSGERGLVVSILLPIPHDLICSIKKSFNISSILSLENRLWHKSWLLYGSLNKRPGFFFRVSHSTRSICLNFKVICSVHQFSPASFIRYWLYAIFFVKLLKTNFAYSSDRYLPDELMVDR